MVTINQSSTLFVLEVFMNDMEPVYGKYLSRYYSLNHENSVHCTFI